MATPSDRSFDDATFRDRAGETVLFALRLLGARYAVEASHVQEVFRIGTATRLPAAPAFLPGVVAHRGEVLALLDLHVLVGQTPLPHEAGRRAALVQHGKYRVALLSEAIEGLVRVSTSRIEPPPSTGQGVAEFLGGVAHDAKGPIALLELPRVIELARARSSA